MRDSYAPRSGVEFVEKDGKYVQTYPNAVLREKSRLDAYMVAWRATHKSTQQYGAAHSTWLAL